MFGQNGPCLTAEGKQERRRSLQGGGWIGVVYWGGGGGGGGWGVWVWGGDKSFDDVPVPHIAHSIAPVKPWRACRAQ